MCVIGVLSPVQSEYGEGIAATDSSVSNGGLVMRCCVVLCVMRLMVSGYLVATGVPMCRTTRERADTGAFSVTHGMEQRGPGTADLTGCTQWALAGVCRAVVRYSKSVEGSLLSLVVCGLSTVKLYEW